MSDEQKTVDDDDTIYHSEVGDYHILSMQMPETYRNPELWLDTIKKKTHEVFLKDKEIRPLAFCLVTANPITGEDDGFLTQVILAPTGPFQEKEKSALVRLVRQFSDAGRALATIFVSEAWVVSAGDDKGLAEAVLQRQRKGGSLEHVEGRKEGVILTYHQRNEGHARLFTALIHRDGDEATLGEFDCHNKEGGKMTGRFSTLMTAAQ